VKNCSIGQGTTEVVTLTTSVRARASLS
jgi:hypothetical protein